MSSKEKGGDATPSAGVVSKTSATPRSTAMRASEPPSWPPPADPTKRCEREVEALLAHAQTAEGFLEASMGEVAAQVLADEHGASLVGRQIGPYEILSLLGKGGMGEVYRARDTKLGRDVAIKVVADAFLSDPERLARFEREARVLATLNHPHIGAIYGLEETERRPRPRARARRGRDARRAPGVGPVADSGGAQRWRARSRTRSKPRTTRASSTAI